MSRKKVYISGQITGLKEADAFALFAKAEEHILSKNAEPVNPMKLPHQHDGRWHSYMREDIKALCDCDAIYMLSNWANSKGAQVEHNLARTLNIEIIYQ